MTPSGQTIGLCMIVKNEAHVIRRCLASVRPLIDHWLIVDTGSTDGTQAVIRAAMADRPGQLVERPWRDFAANRSEALALARPLASYSLIIDADDELIWPRDFTLPDLDAESYTIDVAHGTIVYTRAQLVSNALPWRYDGVLHEFLTCEAARTSGHLPITMRYNGDGARGRDPDTYRKDAAVLEAALATETSLFLVSRYTFYLAQSYRDCGEPRKAIPLYLKRAELGFWVEEIYVSLCAAATLMAACGEPDDAVVATFERATATCPTRVEARHGASRHLRLKSRFEDGFWMAAPGLDLPMPAGGLFLEPWIYDYGLRDEYAVNAYWAGHYRACLDACLTLLTRETLPAEHRGRIGANARFAFDKLADSEPPRKPPASFQTLASARSLVSTLSFGSPFASSWMPAVPQGGTELMATGLRQRLGGALDTVNLQLNGCEMAALDERPLVVWIHHDINQAAVAWLDDKEKASRVAWFVFVSDWQRMRYLRRFGLDPNRCVVLRNATEVRGANRRWSALKPLRMAYTSVPYRGLAILLDAWDLLRPEDAELHIWSSHKLYGPTMDDSAYQALYDRAASLPGVTHHGIVPNANLRAALRDIDVLAYPSIFEETSCLAAIEAMAAGCRVICPVLGALPETTRGFARLYPFTTDPEAHARRFADVLADEIATPWGGFPELADTQQDFAREAYDWSARIAEWRTFIDRVVDTKRPPRMTAAGPAVTSRNRVRESLSRLREVGFRPTGIIDAGAFQGQFSVLARDVFPGAHIVMVDALTENEPVLAKVRADIGNAGHVISMLGERDNQASPFFVVDTTMRPDLVKTGSSKFKENNAFPMEERMIGERRLESILSDHARRFEFVKLDVQGAELEALRGLGSRLSDVEVILLEMSLVDYNEGAPLIHVVMSDLGAMGFVLHDIVEEHRYRDDGLLQIDGIFVRPNSPFRLHPPFWTA